MHLRLFEIAYYYYCCSILCSMHAYTMHSMQISCMNRKTFCAFLALFEMVYYQSYTYFCCSIYCSMHTMHIFCIHRITFSAFLAKYHTTSIIFALYSMHTCVVYIFYIHKTNYCFYKKAHYTELHIVYPTMQCPQLDFRFLVWRMSLK